MAGVAFLPWEKWIAELVHPAYVRFRRWWFERRRHQELLRSEGWRQTEGTVTSIQWDSSLPREGLNYSYSPQEGYCAGFCWRWFDSAIPMEIRAGDRVLLRYNPADPEECVVIGYEQVNQDSVSPVVKRS